MGHGADRAQIPMPAGVRSKRRTDTTADPPTLLPDLRPRRGREADVPQGLTRGAMGLPRMRGPPRVRPDAAAERRGLRRPVGPGPGRHRCDHPGMVARRAGGGRVRIHLEFRCRPVEGRHRAGGRPAGLTRRPGPTCAGASGGARAPHPVRTSSEHLSIICCHLRGSRPAEQSPVRPPPNPPKHPSRRPQPPKPIALAAKGPAGYIGITQRPHSNAGGLFEVGLTSTFFLARWKVAAT